MISVGLLIGKLSEPFAQTPDPQGDRSATLGEESAPAVGVGAESLFVFGTPSPEDTLPAPTPTLFVVLRMVLVLALAAAAIYAVVFLFKRLARPPAQKNPYLKVLASVPLGAGGSVSVVALGNRAWLLGTGSGAGSGGVSLIAEVTDREMVDAMLLEDSRSGEGGQSKFLDFSAILRRLGGGALPDKRFGADDLRKRRERLRNL